MNIENKENDIKFKERSISNDFLNRFLDGDLKELLIEIKNDNDLELFLRGDIVCIYYKSLKILQINQKGGFSVDENYGIENQFPLPPDSWIKYFDNAKRKIDSHKGGQLEKEIQQRIVQENNNSKISNSTDYFILDMEYQQNDTNGRFDAIAVHWTNSPTSRKNGNDLPLAFIEIKVGVGAIQTKNNASKESCGVCKHLEDIKEFTVTLNKNQNLKEFFLVDLEKVITQLRQLELWKFGDKGNTNQIRLSRNKKFELIFILANYNQNSPLLQEELDKIKEDNFDDLEVLFATSSFMGYGLYEKCMIELNDFKNLIN